MKINLKTMKHILFYFILLISFSFAGERDSNKSLAKYSIYEKLYSQCLIGLIIEYPNAPKERREQMEVDAHYDFLSYWVHTEKLGENSSRIVKKRIGQFSEMLMESSNFMRIIDTSPLFFDADGNFKGMTFESTQSDGSVKKFQVKTKKEFTAEMVKFKNYLNSRIVEQNKPSEQKNTPDIEQGK